MKIECVAAPGGAPLFETDLAHGEDPYHAVWLRGLTLTRVLEAERRADDIVLTVQGAPHRNVHLHPRRPRGLDPDVRIAPGERPAVRQRIAAYAIVTSSRGLLGTQYSGLTHVDGQWGLPGGGVDPGEEPGDTVLREVVEESSQRVRLGPLLDVQSDHWIGRAPRGQLEDFHAVRLVYGAHCDDPTDPVVIDVGGTTAAATWTPLDRWDDLRWTTGTKALLKKHLLRHR